MIETVCAFTGHRPKSFPWKYDETARDCILLKEALTAQIMALVNRGVTEFLSDMALGVDIWSAQIILDLRKKNPALKLHCVLPCKGQESKWTTSAQERYRSILAQADEVICVGREYSRNCMLERNRWLVEHSSILLAVYSGTFRSGTGATVRYALKQGREVIIIDPTSRNILRQCFRHI